MNIKMSNDEKSQKVIIDMTPDELASSLKGKIGIGTGSWIILIFIALVPLITIIVPLIMLGSMISNQMAKVSNKIDDLESSIKSDIKGIEDEFKKIIKTIETSIKNDIKTTTIEIKKDVKMLETEVKNDLQILKEYIEDHKSQINEMRKYIEGKLGP
jgi:hypothetical protein